MPRAAPAPTSSKEVAEEPAWTLEQARTALRNASQDRDRLISVTLRFARQTFEFAAAFAVVRGQAVLREALGAAGATTLAWSLWIMFAMPGEPVATDSPSSTAPPAP